MGCFGGVLSCLERYWGLLGFSYYDNILNDSENVLFPVPWSSDGAGQNDTFLMDKLLPWLRQLHGFEDVRVATRVFEKIGQPMLCDDSSSREYYIEIKQAIDSAHMLSYS